MTKKTMMVVDDDKEINELITMCLQREGYDVISCYDGNEALEMARKHSPDLLILDVLLPGLDGFEICGELRKTSTIPIIFVSCKDEDIDKILGLRLGGDDYISKPFSPNELVARVKAHIRRNYQLLKNEVNPSRVLVFEHLTIDPDTHQVVVDEKQIELSPKEFNLLYHLAKNPNRVYKNEQLFSLLWDDIHIGDTRTVMVHIYNLRKKIEDNPSKPKYIQTIRGVGYKFNNQPYEEKQVSVGK